MDVFRPVSLKNRLSLRKAFQELWVAGTMGAFFAAFARNLPGHILEFSWPPDCPYTIDRFVRYGYLSWFLAYFFISNFGNKQTTIVRGKDISYDVVQSAGALVAAYVLGFAVPGKLYGVRYAYGITSGAIIVICLFSLIFFRHDPEPENIQKYINPLRAFGLVISTASAVCAFSFLPQKDSPSTGVLAEFGVLPLLLLLVALAAYIYVRVSSPVAEVKGESGKINVSSSKKLRAKLEVTEIADNMSVTIGIWGSDSYFFSSCEEVGANLVATSKRKLLEATLDLSGHKIRFLRARYSVNEAGSATAFAMKLSVEGLGDPPRVAGGAVPFIAFVGLIIIATLLMYLAP